MLGCPKFVGSSIELPQSDVCTGSREGHALFALVEQSFGALALAASDQQDSDEARLQGEDEHASKHEIAMLLPNPRLPKRDDGGRCGPQDNTKQDRGTKNMNVRCDNVAQ